MRAIENGNFKKALTLMESSFYWASQAIKDFLPRGVVGVYEDQFRDSRDLVRQINAVIKDAGDTSLFYSVLLSSGVTLSDYKRFRECTVITHFVYNTEVTNIGSFPKVRVDINWQGKDSNKNDALWVHNFVVNSIINWQSQGLAPQISGDALDQARVLLKWGDEINMRE